MNTEYADCCGCLAATNPGDTFTLNSLPEYTTAQYIVTKDYMDNGLTIHGHEPESVLPPDSNTLLLEENGLLKLVYREENGVSKRSLLPCIKDVRVFGSAVHVEFGDGTKEVAATRGNDQFSLEQGISICLAKKLLSEKTDGHGHEAYNKLVNHAAKCYKKNREAERKEKLAKEQEEQRRKNKIAKLNKKKSKRLAEKREHMIETQKEAYLRAMRQLESEKK